MGRGRGSRGRGASRGASYASAALSSKNIKNIEIFHLIFPITYFITTVRYNY